MLTLGGLLPRGLQRGQRGGQVPGRQRLAGLLGGLGDRLGGRGGLGGDGRVRPLSGAGFCFPELPRVFRTGNLRLIHAAACPFRYSSMTSCGVRYPSPEWRRVRLYRSSIHRAISSYAFCRVV